LGGIQDYNVSIFRVISVNKTRHRNFLVLNFSPGIFGGFVGSPRDLFGF